MSNRNSLITNLTEGPLSRQIFSYCIPLVLGNLLHTIYNLVDMAIVGQFVGSAGLSAVAISGQITILLYAVGIALGTGGQVIIAQQVGAGDHEGVRKTIGTSFTFTILLSLAVTALGIAFNKPLLRLLNTPTEAWQDAVDYMFWCCLGVPFTYLNGGMSALLRGMGESKRPTIFVAAAAITNVFLDLLFVAVFDMRAKGAAIATSAAQAVGCAACLIYLYRNRDRLGFDFKRESFRMDKKILGTMLKLAAPLALQNIAINISMLFVNAWVNVYGVIASAVSGVGSKLNSLMSIVTMAMQSTVATFTGQNVAAGRQDRVRRTMGITTHFALIFWAVLGSLCILCPRLIFGLFTQEEAVLAMSGEYLSIALWFFLSFALMSSPLGFLSGIGHVTLNMVIALTDGVIARIGLSLLFANVFAMGLHGYWWGSALAGFVSAIGGWAYFFFGKWQKRKLLTDN